MYPMLLLAVSFGVAAFMAWQVYRSAQFPSDRVHRSLRRHDYKRWIGRYQRQPWHAVSCHGDCKALRGFHGRRFLVDDAPPLPLPSCTAPRCDCHYVHHHDRRRGKGDRRAIEGLRAELYQLDESLNRRSSVAGRRRTDLPPGALRAI